MFDVPGVDRFCSDFDCAMGQDGIVNRSAHHVRGGSRSNRREVFVIVERDNGESFTHRA